MKGTIIGEPKYKYGQQEQVTVRNHNRSTTLERGLKPVLPVFFRSLSVKTERNCGSEASDLYKSWQSVNAEAELQVVGSKGRTEVRKRNFTSYKELAEQSAERISCHIIGSQAKWKCGSRLSDLWQSCQVGSVEAELNSFDMSLSY